MLDLLMLAQTATETASTAIFTADNLVALLTLTALEIVLGIDNIVFIAVLSNKLPEHQRAKARQTGIALALITRLLLLFTISWIVGLTKTTLFTIPVLDHPLTWRDVVLIVGGLFLIYKATTEIHHKLEDTTEVLTRPAHAPGDLARTTPGSVTKAAAMPTMSSVITQIILIDVVFSLDSVITAVGMARAFWVMVTAVIIAVGVMLAFAGTISAFIEKHPTMKMLALAFLMLIGVVLVADGLGRHIEKGYIYFAMAFSLTVEVLNLVAQRRKQRKAAAASGA